MESHLTHRNRNRFKRAAAVRKSVRGSLERPRLSVMRSNDHLYAQLIDDDAGVTVASANTLMKKFRTKKQGTPKEIARLIGTEIAERAKEKNVTVAVFDRGFYKYHGVIAELADAARAAGLQF